PMGAACPSWPITPVSTMPSSGTVAFDSTMGHAMRRTRRCVRRICAGAASLIARWHQEIGRRLRDGAVAIILPRLGLHRRITTPDTRDPRRGIGVAPQAGAQEINGEIYCFGRRRQRGKEITGAIVIGAVVTG